MGLVNADIWYGEERRKLKHPRIKSLVIRGWFVQLHFRRLELDQQQRSPLHGPFNLPSEAERFVAKRFGQKAKDMHVQGQISA